MNREEEVPEVNKPRRACLYVPQYFCIEFFFYYSELLSFPAGSWQMNYYSVIRINISIALSAQPEIRL
jgi:hypothetical protein